ncbi:MAG: maltooligosyltrehalose trehalohydrolase, partial [Mycobacterium sp.]|nr:maltooligosyltrehalose trehalohydrolase [Mycobacterium sp.]
MAEHEFAVWAPRPDRVRLDVDGTLHTMTRSDDDWWRVVVDARQDARYGFVLDDDDKVIPDPRSPRQPDGVHEHSQLWDASTAKWTDAGWRGRSIEGAVLYELHVGTFTAASTFDAAIERLDYLADLGVDFVELMPVNAFSGTHGWGYDGVLWYAVHEPYGGPDGLVRFVDACHARGLGVLIDAVFNHLGPSGNYLPKFGPYLSSGSNPWGESVNIADAGADEVRTYIIECALRWMRDFHADGLRLDAVHALVDTTAVHILEELSAETDTLAARLGRPLSLIAESDRNDPRLITPRDRGGLGMTAQWDDDIHHAIHTAVSGERQGYYSDFGSLEALATTLKHGYFHAGIYSSFRGRRHGRPLDTATIPATRLLAYTVTHDQVGNRAVGDRPSQNLTFGQLAVKAALVLGSPYTAMLFMGEEWGASSPFQFFSSHPEPELARATAEGRKAEF